MAEPLWSDRVEELKRKWTDAFVRVRDDRPELVRLAGRIGRVVTVNCSGRALVDFADGPWSDIPASEECLQLVSDEEGRQSYDPKANSAQELPARQA